MLCVQWYLHWLPLTGMCAANGLLDFCLCGTMGPATGVCLPAYCATLVPDVLPLEPLKVWGSGYARCPVISVVVLAQQ